MVCARSRSFRRTIKGWLRWWPPHHCSVPPLPPATLVWLISDLRWNTSLLRYHQQICILIIAITNQHHALLYHSTTRAPPCSTHVPCLRPTILHMHQFLRSWVSVATRTCEDLSQHPSEYESFHYMFILLPYAFQVNSLYVHVSSLYKYSSLLYVFR